MVSKATKGALAATAAATLLVGGAGSLAFWSDEQDVTGATIRSGDLRLTAPVCSGTATTVDGPPKALHDWQFDQGSPFSASSRIVPGDSITKVCEMTLTLTGDHIGATLDLETPSFDDSKSDIGLAGQLTESASFEVNNKPYAAIEKPGTYHIVATVSVDFDLDAATNASRDLASVLNDLTLTATQTHGA